MTFDSSSPGDGGNRVTVGLPFAGVEASILQAAVRSVFAQSHQNWHLILVADGAPSQLVELVLAIRDPRVEVVIRHQREGLATRLNEIATMAETRLLFRMDSDDVMHPHRLRTQSARFESGLDVLASRAVAIDATGAVLGLLGEPPLPVNRAGFLRSHAMTHPTIVARTQWHRENQYDPRLRRAEDKELWLRTSSHTRFCKSEDSVLYYRLGVPSIHKQREDARHDRSLIRAQGPELVGSAATRAMLARSRLKQHVFASLVRVGLGDAVTRRKFVPIDVASLRQHRQWLSEATSAQVPGWE